MTEELSYQINVDADEWATKLALKHGIPADYSFDNIYYDRRKGILTVTFLKEVGEP